MFKSTIAALIGFIIIFSANAQNTTDTTDIVWREGFLDIHHILTGSGDCAFVVMPDGTTMLVDAGDIGDRKLRRGGYPLQPTAAYPDNSVSAGKRIVQYIKQVLPNVTLPVIDYALLTHYHDDHIGGITSKTKTAINGAYKLTGITDVGDALPVRKLIDRDYPDYNFPTDLRIAYQKEPGSFLNLLGFISYQHERNGMMAEKLRPGSTEQIQLKSRKGSYPNFCIRGIKANGTIWSGRGNETIQYFTADSVIDSKGRFNENPLSIAIKISYGKFDYFTGGDNTGLKGFGMPRWFDVETPIAKAVGNVEVTTLCHHGCRDAVNENFLSSLNPQTIVQQTWSSNHPGEEVLHRMIYSGIKNVFATNIQDATKTALGFWLTNTYKSTFGHIIIRVLPGGDKYYVLIAETVKNKVQVKKVFGPFTSVDPVVDDKEKSTDSGRFSAGIQLTAREAQLDKKLSALKNELLLKANQIKLPIYNSSFTQLKPFIESSSLYKILQSMPKGGLLHCHSGGIVNPNWIINAAASYKNCYVYTGKDDDNFIYGQLVVFANGKIPKGFVQFRKYLQGDKNAVDDLLKLLTLNRNDLSEYVDYWVEFEKRFKRIRMLVGYRPFFKEYYREAFNELIRDNVQHVEIRSSLGNLFDEYNENYSVDTAISDLRKIVANIQETQPAFTLKLIFTGYKFLDTTAVSQKLNTAFLLKQKYPNFISGFDLVADEATGNSIGYYKSIWNSISALEKQYSVTMPLYLHAGESSTTLNTNLVDVPFHLNKRIGHGLNLAYFPEIMQRVKLADNLVEVSPISNQELGYVSDLRNHPARVLIANGVQCSINSDDPGIFGYNGLSYDFWLAFMTWDLDLVKLKKMILNSITYSSLGEDEKKRAMEHLKREWDSFIETAIR